MVLSSLPERVETEGQGGRLPHPRELSLREGERPLRAAGFPRSPSPRTGRPAPPGPGRPPTPQLATPPPSALPSQLRLHLEEIVQSIPVGAVDPVIRDEAPGPRGHTGGDRRAGRGGARGHRDFEHLRGGTPEAAAAVATVAGARSPAASHRLRTQEREVASFKHTHTPTAASPGALSRARAAVPYLHALAGGWAEKGARNWETVWRENPSRRWRERGGGGTAKESGSLPLRSFPPHLPPPSLSNPPPFFSFLPLWQWLRWSRLGRLRMLETGEGTRAKASSHATSRWNRVPGRDRAHRDNRSGC